MQMQIIMVRDKETKNTFRYAEHGTTVLGTVDRPGVIYVQKATGINADAICVTIETAKVPEGAVVGQRKTNAKAALAALPLIDDVDFDFDPNF